jgi:hypothetical protein
MQGQESLLLGFEDSSACTDGPFTSNFLLGKPRDGGLQVAALGKNVVNDYKRSFRRRVTRHR